MALFKTFTLDGENSADYGLYISGDAVYDAPERNLELVDIPGRNGALAIDQGRFENIEVTYPAGIFADNQQDFAEKVDAARNWLGSKHYYVTLTDDYHPEYYRMALFRSGLSVSPVAYNRAGSFQIKFECKPQRFLVSGDDPWEQAGNYQTLTDENSVDLQNESGVDIEGATTEIYTITNPTPWESKPLIIATGSGDIGIGNQSITVSGVSEGVNVYIDCDSMEIYRMTGSVPVNMSAYVAFGRNDFPTLAAGVNAITHTMPIQIIPRWWRL